MLSSPADRGVEYPEPDNCDPLLMLSDLNNKDDDDLDYDLEASLASPSSTRSSDSLADSLSSGSMSGSTKANRNRFLYPKIDTVESLRPEQVRWFYKPDGDKKWTAFIGYDSLRIECKFREYMNRYNAKGSLEESVEMVNVRGGLYEVDVMSKKCFPIYWSGTGQLTGVCLHLIFDRLGTHPMYQSH